MGSVGLFYVGLGRVWLIVFGGCWLGGLAWFGFIEACCLLGGAFFLC